jgi:hypothetical protein
MIDQFVNNIYWPQQAGTNDVRQCSTIRIDAIDQMVVRSHLMMLP